ncbi:hypothetical protein HZS55_15790 [Halosimplex rubrum]|uniref:Uncharacterized protein n=1 Tax=Halosimplex rubrum TaxID=869889 RepID=A0A7D5PB25_9EURY|nr:hypothetical protein [Halosimplex rubrum]QLH78660.1 hypothetical protein HZS55_15790 [Halosimplex rubrum]
MATEQPGIPRRVGEMIVMTVTRSTDAGSTLFLTTLPIQIVVGLGVGAEAAMYLYLGIAGASLHAGMFMARRIFNEGYPYQRDVSGTGMSGKYLLAALTVQANVAMLLGVVAGLLAASAGQTVAVIVAMAVPAADIKLGEYAWYLSPSMVVVEVGGRLLGEDALVPEGFRGTLLTESDLLELLGRPRTR